MRYIVRGIRSSDGLQNLLIEEMEKEFHVERAIVFDCGTEKNKVQKEYLSYYSAADLMSYTYPGCFSDVDMALERDILRKMLPYKDIIMEMMKRETNVDIYYYKELSDIYYKMLAYWYALLKKETIDFMLWQVAPHHANEYMLYALARVLKIKCLLLSPCISSAYFVVGNSIENLGLNLKYEYELMQNERECAVNLNDDLEYFYQNNLGMKKKLDKLARKRELKMMHNYFNFLNMSEMLKCHLSVIKWSFWPNNRRSYILDQMKWRLELNHRAQKYKKKLVTIKRYDKISQLASSNLRYIYFGLQFQPEQTTLPNAGEYRNQLLSIAVLAKAAKHFNIEVWVKEHWVQLYREKSFYKQLEQIENVRLIKSTEDTNEIINNSIAVSTQTGSCILEAVVKGKPVFVFGEGYPYKGAPNVYLINSVEECENYIGRIINNEMILSTERERRLYMKAFEKGCVLQYIDDIKEASVYYNKQETAKKIVQFIYKEVSS